VDDNDQQRRKYIFPHLCCFSTNHSIPISGHYFHFAVHFLHLYFHYLNFAVHYLHFAVHYLNFDVYYLHFAVHFATLALNLPQIILPTFSFFHLLHYFFFICRQFNLVSSTNAHTLSSRTRPTVFLPTGLDYQLSGRHH